MGLTSALAMAGNALEVFSNGIQVAGQNISNSTTPGYVREKLILQTAGTAVQNGLVLGSGVAATSVVQQIDKFLETRIYSANADAAGAVARQAAYQDIEVQMGALGEGDIASGISRFLASLSTVADQPDSGPNRGFAIEQGKQLASRITRLRQQIDTSRNFATQRVSALASEANQLIDTVNTLNKRISQVEQGGLLGSDAGTLRSQRYQALDRLSEIVSIQVNEQSDGQVSIYVGSETLLDAGSKQQIEVNPLMDRGLLVSALSLSKTGATLPAVSGEITGELEGRDDILGGFVDQLDQLTGQLIQGFNELHTSGRGVKGFTDLTSAQRVKDSSADLNAAGLDVTPQHGSFLLAVKNSDTGVEQSQRIQIDLDGIGADSSLEDVRAAIDAADNVSASITSDGRLQIQAGNGYEYFVSDDSSGFLSAIGLNTFFTGSGSADIAVNSVLASNSNYLATGQGGGPSDGRNATLLAQFADQASDALDGKSISAFYNTIVASTAQASASEQAVAAGFSAYKNTLDGQRSQKSGVSLDEEAISMMQYQQAYQASARMISVVDELFTVLLNL